MRYICTRRCLLVLTSMVVLAALFSTLLLAQSTNKAFASKPKTLERKFDPVVFRIGPTSGLYRLRVNDLFAYKFDAANNKWARIPFQIDTLDSKGQQLLATNVVVDSNFTDEAVFMPEDAGDQADINQWLPDAGAQQFKRFELEVADPLTPDKKGWVYLYQKVATAPPVKGYIDYVPAPQGAGSDTVKGLTYVEGHNSIGWTNSVKLPKVSDLNLFDQFKIRLKGSSFLIGSYTATEKDNINFVSLNFGKGPVRGLRLWEFEIFLMVAGNPFSLGKVPFTTQYYPYSSLLGGNFIVSSQNTALAGLNLLRLSQDLSANASGMQFYSSTDATKSYLIDGVEDLPGSTLQDRTWLMATGTRGTILILVKVPTISGTARKLYYYDNSTSGRTGDGTPDTGDLKSYGDMGIRFDGTVTGTLTLSFDLNTFYLDPAANPRALGEQLNSFRQFPMEVAVRPQTMTPSAVAEPGKNPNAFALFDAHPNPFKTSEGVVRINFNLGVNSRSARLRLFNLLGQEVARFDVADLLQNQTVLWDGRDRLGRLVPAGVYFYQLQAGRQRAVKKLVLMR